MRFLPKTDYGKIMLGWAVIIPTGLFAYVKLRTHVEAKNAEKMKQRRLEMKRMKEEEAKES